MKSACVGVLSIIDIFLSFTLSFLLFAHNSSRGTEQTFMKFGLRSFTKIWICVKICSK